MKDLNSKDINKNTSPTAIQTYLEFLKFSAKISKFNLSENSDFLIYKKRVVVNSSLCC